MDVVSVCVVGTLNVRHAVGSPSKITFYLLPAVLFNYSDFFGSGCRVLEILATVLPVLKCV